MCKTLFLVPYVHDTTIFHNCNLCVCALKAAFVCIKTNSFYLHKYCSQLLCRKNSCSLYFRKSIQLHCPIVQYLAISMPWQQTLQKVSWTILPEAKPIIVGSHCLSPVCIDQVTCSCRNQFFSLQYRKDIFNCSKEDHQGGQEAGRLGWGRQAEGSQLAQLKDNKALEGRVSILPIPMRWSLRRQSWALESGTYWEMKLEVRRNPLLRGAKQ